MSLGKKFSICGDAWIPGNVNFRLSSLVLNMQNLTVAKLIDANDRTWKQRIINITFSKAAAVNIFRILLAQEAHDDFLVWGREPSGVFSVCSAYKLLKRN